MGASQIEHKYNECNFICDLIPNLNKHYYNSLEEEDDATVVASNKSPENRVSKDALHREREHMWSAERMITLVEQQ